MYSTPWYKRILRPLGIEVKRFAFGLDAWPDLATLFDRRRAQVIFDVGANRGQTSRQLTSTLPGAKIWAFEPNPSIFSELQRNVADLENVTTVNMALGDSQTQARLKITGSSLNTSLLTYSREDGTDRIIQEVDVPVSTLDKFCSEHGIDSVDLLKTDVQGYDLRVLQGAEQMLQAGRIHAVFSEVLFRHIYDGQCNFEDVYRYLMPFGFRFCGFYDGIREKDFHLHWADALFIRPESFDVPKK